METIELQKQIRIGNYLLGKCIDDLDDRKEWWEIYKIQDAEDLMAVKEDWDKPIPLTEEVLLKCGFLNFGNRWMRSELPLDIIMSNGLYMSYVVNEIKYLHQLQNLYWCLCGKELDVNL